MRKRFSLIDIADRTGLEMAIIAEWAEQNDVAIENSNYVFNGSDLRTLAELAEGLDQEPADAEDDEPEDDEPEDDEPEDDEPEDDEPEDDEPEGLGEDE